MYVIARDTIPSIHNVEVDGKTVNLGTLKDLRKNPLFFQHIPEYARLSVSWVHLDPFERLNEHRHPTTSIIIITEGEGEVSGDVKGVLQSGDVVLVPPGSLHGFVGRGAKGFWALSIQLEGQGLYENPAAPRAKFEQSEISETESKLRTLINENDQYLEEYRSNSLVKLVQSDLAKRDEVRARMLDYLQTWSDAFQRVLFARGAVESDPEFQNLAETHIREEIGHNQSLREMRQEMPREISDDKRTAAWDPVLAAASSWFVERMSVLSPEEKTVLVHFVLEGSGEIFHSAALASFPNSKHFKLHSSVDEDHFKIGVDTLRKQANLDIKKSRETLERGWAMINALSTRIAELAVGGGVI